MKHWKSKINHRTSRIHHSSHTTEGNTKLTLSSSVIQSLNHYYEENEKTSFHDKNLC